MHTFHCPCVFPDPYSINFNEVMIVFFHQVCATLGSTGSCAFDNLNEVIFISNIHVIVLYFDLY